MIRYCGNEDPGDMFPFLQVRTESRSSRTWTGIRTDVFTENDHWADDAEDPLPRGMRPAFPFLEPGLVLYTYVAARTDHI